MTHEHEVRIRSWLIPLVAALASAVVTAAIWGGGSTQRVTDLEQRANQQGTDIRADQSELAAHDKQLAVIQSQYEEITRRLDAIDQKLGNKS